MDVLLAYFADLTFFSTSSEQGYTKYVAKLTGQLADSWRTVFVFVPDQMASLTKGKIDQLAWCNLQTRMIKTSSDEPLLRRLPIQSWKPPRNTPNVNLAIVERNKKQTTYHDELGEAEVVILHKPGVKSSYQYPNENNLLRALDTFSCSVNLLQCALELPEKSTLSNISTDTIETFEEGLALPNHVIERFAKTRLDSSTVETFGDPSETARGSTSSTVETLV